MSDLEMKIDKEKEANKILRSELRENEIYIQECKTNVKIALERVSPFLFLNILLYKISYICDISYKV